MHVFKEHMYIHNIIICITYYDFQMSTPNNISNSQFDTSVSLTSLARQ